MTAVAGRLVGYARVSTVEQDTQLQLDAMKAAGVLEVHQEKKSSVLARPVLEALLEQLQAGEVLVVYKIDRLARSLYHLMGLLRQLEEKGVGFRSLTEPIDNTNAAGRLMLQILGAFAEFERAVIRERCTAGRVAAVERGVRMGRPGRFSEEEEGEIRQAVAAGASKGELAKRYDVHRQTIDRVLGCGRFAPGGYESRRRSKPRGAGCP